MKRQGTIKYLNHPIFDYEIVDEINSTQKTLWIIPKVLFIKGNGKVYNRTTNRYHFYDSDWKQFDAAIWPPGAWENFLDVTHKVVNNSFDYAYKLFRIFTSHLDLSHPDFEIKDSTIDSLFQINCRFKMDLISPSDKYYHKAVVHNTDFLTHTENHFRSYVRNKLNGEFVSLDNSERSGYVLEEKVNAYYKRHKIINPEPFFFHQHRLKQTVIVHEIGHMLGLEHIMRIVDPKINRVANLIEDYVDFKSVHYTDDLLGVGNNLSKYDAKPWLDALTDSTALTESNWHVVAQKDIYEIHF